MKDKQNEGAMDKSTLTECNPCKFTFDVAPTDVKAARNAGDQDKKNTAVSDLPKVEIVDGRSERSLSEGRDNSSNARQPREICANPDAQDWSPLKCDEAAKDSKQVLGGMTPPKSEKNLSGDVRDICKNPDAGDWAPAKCNTSPKQPK